MPICSSTHLQAIILHTSKAGFTHFDWIIRTYYTKSFSVSIFNFMKAVCMVCDVCFAIAHQSNPSRIPALLEKKCEIKVVQVLQVLFWLQAHASLVRSRSCPLCMCQVQVSLSSSGLYFRGSLAQTRSSCRQWWRYFVNDINDAVYVPTET